MNDNSAAAAALFAANPIGLGGMWLRGSGPARDALVEWLRDRLAVPVRRLPVAVDADRLLGGIDVAASLAAGRPIRTPGIIEEMTGGVLIVPMAERLDEAVAALIATAETRLAIVLLDDGTEATERPPAALVERAAFHLTVEHFDPVTPAPPAPAEIGDAMREALVAASLALGVDSIRALRFAEAAARGAAVQAGRAEVAEDDLIDAIRFVLAPRATRLPNEPEAEDEADAPPPPPDADHAEQNAGGEVRPLEDRIVDAVRAMLPADLDPAAATSNRRVPSRQAGRGDRRRSLARGRPRGAIPGRPRGGARLALVDTLRAAVPWQALRRAETGRDGLLLRTSDLRIRRFEERMGTVTIFAVDASGSSAAARLAEAKGAVERLLERAHVTRAQAALIAFRGKGAELLLPPTRSLTRVRRALASLPGGGGTPLAIGIDSARALAEAVAAKGQSPFIVLLTDGRANLTADGVADRPRAAAEADAAARRLFATGFASVVIDISPRPQAEAARVAAAMGARYLPLPRADSGTLAKALAA